MPPSPKLIASQLEAVAKRLIDRAFKPLYKQGPIEAPELYELVAQRDPAAWEAHPAGALRAAIEQAARKLPEETIEDAASVTYRQAALWLFDIEQPPDLKLEGKEYDKRFNHVFDSDARLRYLSDSQRKDKASRIRVSLAKALLATNEKLDLAAEDSNHKSTLAIVGTLEPALELSSDISALLEAEVAAARNLPYWPYDVTLPSLGDIYIQPPIVALNYPRTTHSSIFTILQTDQHVVILGEAGAGKSTLALQTVAALARALLSSEPHSDRMELPLYVPARLMAEGESLHNALAAGLNHHLSAYLTSQLDESLFTRGLPDGYNWLIFIDGLDEVIDPTLRGRLLAQIAHHATNSRYRFVLTSRRLDNGVAELRPSVGQYKLEPFSLDQLNQFARSWFMARSSTDPEAEAVRFVQELASREMVSMPEDQYRNTRRNVRDIFSASNPLIATIALLAYVLDEGRLPATLPELYETFVTYLLFQRQTQVRSREHLRKVLAVGGSHGLQLADYLYDNRRLLCSHLAWRLFANDPRALVDIAAEWISQTFSRPIQIPRFTEFLETILIDTGLVIRQGSGLSFIHRSVAEYLAAPLARLPGPVENNHLWRNHEIEAGRQLYLYFRILAWAKEHDASPLIRQFFERGRFASYVRLGWLVKNGLPLNDEDIAQYLGFFTYYYKFFIGPDAEDESWEHVTETDVVLLLCDLAPRYQEFADQLRNMVDEDIESTARIAGLVGLWRLGDHEFVLSRLQPFIQSRDITRQVDLAGFYISIGDEPAAVAVLNRVALTATAPSTIHRAASLLEKVGVTPLACRWVTEALMYSRVDWRSRFALATHLDKLGAPQTARETLRRLLSYECCSERGTAVLETITFRRMGWGDASWVNDLYNEERLRLLHDPAVTLHTRQLIFMLDEANLSGMEWEWEMSKELFHRLDLFRAAEGA